MRWVPSLNAKAEYHVELGQPELALQVLHDMRGDPRNAMFGYQHALSLIVECKARTQLRQLPEARDCLARALAFADNPLQSGSLRIVRRWLPSLFAAALEQKIEVRTVRALIHDWKLQPANLADATWPWPVRIRTLGCFEILIDDVAPEFSRKLPARLIALLKAIIAFGGTEVPEHILIDAIWPDEAGDAGARALNVALTRLRKLLVHGDVIQVANGKIHLDRNRCWIDALVFEQMAAGSKPMLEFSDEAGRHSREAEEAIALYKGDFLHADGDASWAVPARERLRNLFVRQIEILGNYFEAHGEWEQAAKAFQRGIDADSLFELFYRGLIRCHMKAGRRAEALSAYRSLRRTLSVVLGIAPSPETAALYQEIYSSLPGAGIFNR